MSVTLPLVPVALQENYCYELLDRERREISRNPYVKSTEKQTRMKEKVALSRGGVGGGGGVGGWGGEERNCSRF